MNLTRSRLIEQAKANGMLPEIPKNVQLPTPSINKVELYPSFHGNDSCTHCITNSGPHRKNLLHPEKANIAIKNVAKHSILTTLSKLLPNGEFQFIAPKSISRLDTSPHPPASLENCLIQEYADSIMGKGASTLWHYGHQSLLLNFGRPSIRISGGEFFTWPHQLNGEKIPLQQRLSFQQNLLATIRYELPDYDIWILTNGRFAENDQLTDVVVSHWSSIKNVDNNSGGRTRIAISVDPFHKPPKGSSIEQMLSRLWKSSLHHLNAAPYVYGVTQKRLFLVGRALNHFNQGAISCSNYKKTTDSPLFNLGRLEGDPNNLVESDGCNELKGFICQTPAGAVLVNNIVINDMGNLAYCCVGVGNYGDFLNSPQEALQQMLKDPISLMLRNGSTAEKLLNLAVAIDPSIKTFGDSQFERATGSTCYQILSGKRVQNVGSES